MPPKIYRERYAPDEPRPESPVRHDYENWLVGTLNTAEIKHDGLVKKVCILVPRCTTPAHMPQTIGLTIDGLSYHLVSYYDPEVRLPPLV